jgi:hypothetical protein
LAVRRNRLKRSALWTGAGLIVLVAGLIITFHERHAHDSCIVSTYLGGQGRVQPTSSCGFVDTAYWVGVLMLIFGALFSFGAGGILVSDLMRLRNARARIGVRLTRLNGALRARIQPSPQTPAVADVIAVKARPSLDILHSHLVLTHNHPSRRPAKGQTWRPPAAPAPTAPEPIVAASMQPARSPVQASMTTITGYPPSFEPAPETAPLPPPAWYPDPERSGAIRWWDGRVWGESRVTVP